MKKITTILALFTLVVSECWAAVTVTAKVSGGNTVEAGSRFQVEYVVNDACDDFSCDAASSGLRVLSGPFSSSYMSRRMVNGATTVEQTTTYTYVMMADAEGEYTLPAAKAVVGGKEYRSNQLAVKVLPADPNKKQAQQSSSRSQASSSSNGLSKDDYHLAVDLSKTTVYEGEALVATMKLYFRNQQVTNVNEVKFPDMEGFTAQDIDLGNVEATLEQYKGENYRAYPLHQWLLFPQHSGEIKVKNGSLNAIVQVYTGRRSFWDDPFNSYQNVALPLTSPERTIVVKTLPAGKPASYMNAVGNFSITSEMTASTIKANDAVIYRITIEGTGNLKYVREPKPEFPADFEVFDPKADLQSRTTRAGVAGKKVIEYTIIPRFAGTFQIPAVEFSYFDPKAEKYVTKSTQAFTLEVEKGANDTSSDGGAATNYAGTTQERIKVLGNDIRYIHPLSESDLKADDSTWFGSLYYWLALLLPTLILAVFAFVYRRQLKLNADVVGQRTRKANKVATKRLREASVALKAKKESDFYEAVHKAMLGYVSDKLSIPLSELNVDSIKEQLVAAKVDEAVIKQCIDVLQTCEFARYAPSTDSQAMDKLYNQAAQTIDQLEKVL